jgi:hypothetical protein
MRSVQGEPWIFGAKQDSAAMKRRDESEPATDWLKVTQAEQIVF